MRSLSSRWAIAIAQTVAVLGTTLPVTATSIGTPPGGNRVPLTFRSGTPFSVSTWTPAQNAHVPGIANGKGLAKNGFALDLTSINPSITLSRALLSRVHTVSLNLGGTSQIFSAGMKVTPAEYIAILQTIKKSDFLLSLGANGDAVGGIFSLNGLISPRITALKIPAGVIALDNMARNPLMGLAGDLVNFGTIYAYSSSPRIHTGLIYAGFGGSISNESGGLISTFVPSGLLASTVRVLPTVGLVLAADQDIINQGSIIGSGSLKLATAYGGIFNTTSLTSAPASIQAAGDIKFVPGTTGSYKAPTGMASVTNTGIVTSTGGNISFNTPLALADFFITGIGTASNGTTNVPVTGLFQAYQGSVDVRDSKYKGPANILLNGGEYQGSNGFNTWAGFGNIIGDGSLATNSLNNGVQTSAILAGILSTHTMGSVSLVDQTTTGITVKPSTGGTFALSTAGSTNLNSITTSTGNLSVVASTGTLQVLPAVQLTANNGALTLQNLDDTDGSIVIGTGSNLNTTGAASGPSGTDVVLAVGAPITETNPVTGSIANVTINNVSSADSVYGGAAGFTANPATNVLTVKSGDIVFSTAGNATADSIMLNGSVNITTGAAPVGFTEKTESNEMIVDAGDDADAL